VPDKYKYDEKKGYFAGLPARDLSVDEWKQLPEELAKAALKMGMFKLIKETKKEVENA